MRPILLFLLLTALSCNTNDNKQKETTGKTTETVNSIKKDSAPPAGNNKVTDVPVNAPNTPVTDNLPGASKYTGSWVGQGEDRIMINYSNGQYLITLDADNTSQPNKTVVKAKEENGKLIVEPGIYYGYNGMSTMIPIGNNKLVLHSGRNTYTYERPQY